MSQADGLSEIALDESSANKRLAYADPPYPGLSRSHYGKHKDFAGEVDHSILFATLEEYDGWALSTNNKNLRPVLSLAPDGARVAAWCNPNSQPWQSRGVTPSWEPVIYRPAREIVPGRARIRDYLLAHSNSGFLDRAGEHKIIGQKPPWFTEWVLELLGAVPTDELHDLFPGSGAVARAWESWRNQTRIAI